MWANRSYSGYIDPYRHLVYQWRAQGLTPREIGRRLYDRGLRAPRSLFVQPRDPEVEREPMAACIGAAIWYMEKRDKLMRRISGWAREEDFWL
jgi:hypothetical protein